jgi:hypothetical protein
MSYVPAYVPVQPVYVQPTYVVQPPLQQPTYVVQPPQPTKPLTNAQVIAQAIAVSCIALGVLGIVIGSSVGCPPLFIIGISLAAVGLVACVPAGIPIILDYNIGWRRSYFCTPRSHFSIHARPCRRF